MLVKIGGSPDIQRGESGEAQDRAAELLAVSLAEMIVAAEPQVGKAVIEDLTFAGL